MQFVTRFYPPRVSDTTCAYYAQMRATRTRAHFSSSASACLCKAKVLCRSAYAHDCFCVFCVVRIGYTVENAFSASILPSLLHQPWRSALFRCTVLVLIASSAVPQTVRTYAFMLLILLASSTISIFYAFFFAYVNQFCNLRFNFTHPPEPQHSI